MVSRGLNPFIYTKEKKLVSSFTVNYSSWSSSTILIQERWLTDRFVGTPLVLQQECHFDCNSSIIIVDLWMLKGKPVVNSQSFTTLAGANTTWESGGANWVCAKVRPDTSKWNKWRPASLIMATVAQIKFRLQFALIRITITKLSVLINLSSNEMKYVCCRKIKTKRARQFLAPLLDG